MAVNRALLATIMWVMFAILLSIVSPSVEAQSLPPAPSPSPAPAPSSDGTSIDQGIAYALMIVALLLTYLIHPLDAFPVPHVIIERWIINLLNGSPLGVGYREEGV